MILGYSYLMVEEGGVINISPNVTFSMSPSQLGSSQRLIIAMLDMQSTLSNMIPLRFVYKLERCL